ncbi:MAG: ketopantoate reductase family protein [Armatimonadetes bacterium]|nr:ketopantoate reductase family protein [Armatimonadota bacterium]
MSSDHITIVGAGAIGGTIGAYLVRAGHGVTFVDAVEEHVRAINDRGLTIEGSGETFTVRAPAVTPQEIRDPLGTVFLAVKTMHTDPATAQLAPYLAANGVVVSMQNGFNEERIAAIVGRERTIGAFVNFGADYLEPGRILYGGSGALYVGELDGSESGRLGRLVKVLLDFMPNAQATSNIWGYLWGKHAYGAMLKTTALVDAPIADVLSDSTARPVLGNVAAEVLAVAAAEGVRPEGFDGFDPPAFAFPPRRDAGRVEASLDALVAFNRKSLKAKSGIWRDLAVRKRKTEVESMVSELRARALRHGLPIPLVEALGGMILEIESGARQMSWDNIAALAAISARAYGSEGVHA